MSRRGSSCPLASLGWSAIRVVGKGRAVDPLRIRECFGEVGLGEGEEFFLIELWLPVVHYQHLLLAVCVPSAALHFETVQ